MDVEGRKEGASLFEDVQLVELVGPSPCKVRSRQGRDYGSVYQFAYCTRPTDNQLKLLGWLRKYKIATHVVVVLSSSSSSSSSSHV